VLSTEKRNTKAKFNPKEIQELFGVNITFSSLISICTDSRNIEQDKVFLPLVGEKFDGHHFINDVFNKNVKLSFCEKNKLSKVKDEYKSKLIVVDSTLSAYHKLANYYRKKINPKVIGVTGSSGKTTVKDLLACVLGVKFKVHKTEANFNNEIGLPKTILEMPEDTQVLVLELAMRQKGEIAYLSKTCEPDIAIITNVGTAHIGRLGSKDEIVKAKCEILEHLRKNGLAILPKDLTLTKFSEKKLFFALDLVSEIKFDQGKSFFKYSRNLIPESVKAVISKFSPFPVTLRHGSALPKLRSPYFGTMFADSRSSEFFFLP